METLPCTKHSPSPYFFRVDTGWCKQITWLSARGVQWRLDRNGNFALRGRQYWNPTFNLQDSVHTHLALQNPFYITKRFWRIEGRDLLWPSPVSNSKVTCKLSIQFSASSGWGLRMAGDICPIPIGFGRHALAALKQMRHSLTMLPKQSRFIEILWHVILVQLLWWFFFNHSTLGANNNLSSSN